MAGRETMSRGKIFEFVRAHRLVVIASVSHNGVPEPALVGIAMVRDTRIVFDTLKQSRNYETLRHWSEVALVVGWEDEITVKLEGLAEERTAADLGRCKDAYFAVYPEGRGREAWPDIAYIGVRITWMRYGDNDSGGIRVVEHSC